MSKKRIRLEKGGAKRKEERNLSKNKDEIPLKAAIPKTKFPPVQAKCTPESFQDKCSFIAELSEAILQEPQQAFVASRKDPNCVVSLNDDGESVKCLNRMKRLIDMANQGGDYDKDKFASVEERHHVARLAMVSLVSIFGDILPTYRIRPPTEAELSVKVSKDVRQLWEYEASLLTHYQQFLNVLERTWESPLGKKSFPPQALGATAIMCLCELLKSASHFNFRSRILQTVVQTLNYNSSSWLAQKTQSLLKEGGGELYEGNGEITMETQDAHEINVQCCEALSYVFKTDKQGDISLEAVRLLSKTLKDRKCRVHPLVLATLKSLPLRVHEDEAAAAKLHAQVSKKKRKLHAANAQIEAELNEKNATVDKGMLARSQAETLELVTVMYFRVIQTASQELDDASSEDQVNGAVKTHKSKKLSATTLLLLPVALEGLAKFTHLINMETVVDLLHFLKQLLQNVDLLPVDAALNCVLTAFQTLQGPGRELPIDPKEYVTPLYFQLPRLYSCSDSRHVGIALKCLDFAFIQRKEYSMVRVAAFVKQILSVALHTPPHASASLIAFVRALTNRYSGLDRLFENELDVVASGTYNPNVDDPEHSNPFSANAWEVSLSKFHINAIVAKQAEDCGALKLPQLPKEAPESIHMALFNEAKEGYIRHRVVLKRHPLAKQQSKNYSQQQAKNTLQQQQQLNFRFIKPNKAQLTLIHFDEKPVTPIDF